MFCENEKSFHPTTHTLTSYPKPNTSHSKSSRDIFFQQCGADGKTDKPKESYMYNDNGLKHQACIPLSKSASLKTFDHCEDTQNSYLNKTNDSGYCEEYQSKNITGNKNSEKSSNMNKSSFNTIQLSSKANNERTTTIPTTPSLKPDNGYSYLIGNKNNFKKFNDLSSNDDNFDFSFEKNAPVSEMYNEDIDYMNNYLKSLPDYNELNKKISNEQQKCEDIYDRLQSINSSLKSNQLLPKSNSYHSIYTTPANSYLNVNKKQNPVQDDNNFKNKIVRSNSSSTVNQNLMNSPNKLGVNPMKSANLVNSLINTDQSITKSTRIAPKTKTNNKEFNCDQNRQYMLPKSASSSCLTRSNSKKGLNEFWSENLAKNSQQKLGWNYNRIMAIKPANDLNTSQIENDYKLQKNMSLSQLDKTIRENLSREELYNLICNTGHKASEIVSPLVSIQKKHSVPSSNYQNSPHLKLETKVNYFQKVQQPQFRNPLVEKQDIYDTQKNINSLLKSTSQTNMPTVINQFANVKSPRKASIPTLFKPLCKSSSNTHVFNCNYNALAEPHETFTPKLLVKSSSSSSVFNTSPSNFFNTTNLKNNHLNNDNKNNQSTNSSILQSCKFLGKISKNNELMKTSQKILQGNIATSEGNNVTSKLHQRQTLLSKHAEDDLLGNQNNLTSKKIVLKNSYNSPQVETYSNLPPAPSINKTKSSIESNNHQLVTLKSKNVPKYDSPAYFSLSNTERDPLTELNPIAVPTAPKDNLRECAVPEIFSNKIPRTLSTSSIQDIAKLYKVNHKQHLFENTTHVTNNKINNPTVEPHRDNYFTKSNFKPPTEGTQPNAQRELKSQSAQNPMIIKSKIKTILNRPHVIQPTQNYGQSNFFFTDHNGVTSSNTNSSSNQNYGLLNGNHIRPTISNVAPNYIGKTFQQTPNIYNLSTDSGPPYALKTSKSATVLGQTKHNWLEQNTYEFIDMTSSYIKSKEVKSVLYFYKAI